MAVFTATIPVTGARNPPNNGITAPFTYSGLDLSINQVGVETRSIPSPNLNTGPDAVSGFPSTVYYGANAQGISGFTPSIDVTITLPDSYGLTAAAVGLVSVYVYYSGILTGAGYGVTYHLDNIPLRLVTNPPILGCRDPLATNYNPLATVDNGSCVYPASGGGGGGGPTPVPGCTNPRATNYNPAATVDNGTCIFPVPGCTNPVAINYNPLANLDDGSCILPVRGCTIIGSLNYNPVANVNDGSCIPVVAGCTNPAATNYNAHANTDDGSCILLIRGCKDPNATNYNPAATIDDGSCTYPRPNIARICPVPAPLGIKFPDWDLPRSFIDMGPGWLPGCHQGAAYAGEETLLAGMLRGIEAGTQPIRQRLRDWSTTDSADWASLHAESPVWRGDATPYNVGSPGLYLDGTALPLPSSCSAHHFWGENAGPRLLVENGIVYARTLGFRVSVSGSVANGMWFRRGPVAGFPYYGAWMQPWFDGDTGQVAAGDAYELSSPGIEPTQVSVVGGHLWPSASLLRFDPADDATKARGCPSRILIPWDPLPRNPAEKHAARITRILALTALAESTLGLRLTGALGRVTMSTSPSANAIPVRIPSFTIEKSEFLQDSVVGLTGLLITATPLEARTPSLLLGGGGIVPQTRRSPFAYAGRPCASDRRLRVLPCTNLVPDSAGILAPAVSAPSRFSVLSARSIRNPSVLYASTTSPVSVLTPADSVLRGGSLRIPGGTCRSFTRTPVRARWGDSAPEGGSTLLSGSGIRVASTAPFSGTPVPCFV